jgi:hypothetical protein
MAGAVIYEAHPAMFRAHPFWFIGCVILIPVFGLGVLLRLYWYIHTRQTALTVTDTEILYERRHLEQGPLGHFHPCISANFCVSKTVSSVGC